MSIIREAIEEAIIMLHKGFPQNKIVALLDSMMPENTRKKIVRRALKITKKN